MMPFGDLAVGSKTKAKPATLSFGGVPEVTSPPVTANLSYNRPSPSTSIFSGFFTGNAADYVFGTPANSPATAVDVNRQTAIYTQNAETRRAGGNITNTITTALRDGASAYRDTLKDKLGDVLSNIGSSGDATVTQAAFGRDPEPQQGVLTPAVILAVLGVAGVIYFATQKG